MKKIYLTFKNKNLKQIIQYFEVKHIVIFIFFDYKKNKMAA